VKATVNGVARELADGTTLEALLRELGATQDGLAVAINDRVIRRSDHAGLTLAEGDAIEIVRAVSGG
jgi:sulfur carrier protein